MEKYPLLYRKRNASMQETCMCWGICCGEGWHNLIDDLSAKIEKIIAALPEDKQGYIYAQQVKEKWGSLSFYMSYSNEEIDELIDEAELKSELTCEVCGEPGTIDQRMGWLSCRCPTCNTKEDEK